MGKLLRIPNVGVLTFDNTEWTTHLPINRMDDSQRNALELVVSGNLRMNNYDYIASSVDTDYCGVYVSGNSYYVGYNKHNSVTYNAYYNPPNGAIIQIPSDEGVYISDYANSRANLPTFFEPYASYQELYDALADIRRYPITYRPTNSSFPNAPVEGVVGSDVVVPVSFPDGYGLANPENIYVQCNGVVVPSTYENGQLTFVMPDPS